MVLKSSTNYYKRKPERILSLFTPILFILDPLRNGLQETPRMIHIVNESILVGDKLGKKKEIYQSRFRAKTRNTLSVLQGTGYFQNWKGKFLKMS